MKDEQTMWSGGLVEQQIASQVPVCVCLFVTGVIVTSHSHGFVVPLVVELAAASPLFVPESLPLPPL